MAARTFPRRKTIHFDGVTVRLDGVLMHKSTRALLTQEYQQDRSSRQQNERRTRGVTRCGCVRYLLIV